MINLFDTHTHFDVEDFDLDREQLAKQAFQQGVKGLILIGITAQRFPDLIQTKKVLDKMTGVPKSYLAPGLHPFYIQQHLPKHLEQLEQVLKQDPCVAIGEIGLDFFLAEHKIPEIKQQQQDYFEQQLELARSYDKPIILHIRKAHGEVLALLKKHKFKHGGFAHAFSGGVEEAKAFTRLGFKIGVTGQITNPNSKRLHKVVQSLNLCDLVLETDCPDMTPLCCQISTETKTRNTPANLPFVLDGLAKVLNLERQVVAEHLWHNTLTSLGLEFP